MIDATAVLGLLGVLLSLASFVMKRMIALRTLALAANFVFIGFAIAQLVERHVDLTVPLPGLIMNCVLIPVNVRRIWEIRKVARELENQDADAPLSQWLLPRMRPRRFDAGEVVFRKGDHADKLIYIAAGELTLVEIDKRVGPGEFLGEIGLFSPQKQRTLTLTARTSGELYELPEEELYTAYFQDPRIGFHIVRLVAGRLIADVQREQTRTGPI